MRPDEMSLHICEVLDEAVDEQPLLVETTAKEEWDKKNLLSR